MDIYKEIENDLESLIVQVEGKRDRFILEMDSKIKEAKELLEELTGEVEK